MRSSSTAGASEHVAPSLMKPAAQVKSQVPPLQTGAPLAGAGHVLQDAPQLVALSALQLPLQRR